MSPTRRAKDAARKRKKRASLNRLHASRSLTPRLEKHVAGLSRAMSSATAEQFSLANTYNCTLKKFVSVLTFADLSLLMKSHSWLTDTVLDWHSASVAESASVDRSKVRLMNSSTFQILCASKNPGRVEDDHLSKQEARQRPKPGIQEFTLLIFPVCLDEHWLVVSVEPLQRRVSIYDSKVGTGKARFHKLERLFLAYTDHFGQQDYVVTSVEAYQQTTGYDCGVIAADRIAALLGANSGRILCTDSVTTAQYRARMLLSALNTIYAGDD